MALALRTDVVFRLKFTAIRKSLAPITDRPVEAVLSVYRAGPKSGFHSGSFIFASNPSYSPALHTARFFLFSENAADS